MNFAKSGFGQFMASGSGRMLRAVVGIVLIWVGYAVLTGVVGWVVAVIGLIPLLAGLFDFCLVSVLMGGPFAGKDIRAQGQMSTR